MVSSGHDHAWSIALVAAIGVLWYTAVVNRLPRLSQSVAKMSVRSNWIAVLVDKMQVGEVDSVSLRQGVPVAALKLKRGLRQRDSCDSHFEVGSLKWILPGNMESRLSPTKNRDRRLAWGPRGRH